MTQEAAVPASWRGQIQKWIDAAVAKALRSAPQRSSSITAGRFTIRNGALVVENDAGQTSAFFGGIYPAMPDGTVQPGFILYREDGSLAAALYDPTPDPSTPGGFKQFFAIYDREGNRILSDDTDSGQGLSRPNLPFAAYPSRSSDWPTTTSTSFATVHRAKGLKQQPGLFVETWANATDPGATAEVRVMVNDVQLDVTKTTTPGFVTGLNFGPASVAGPIRSTLNIEIQYRLASGVGEVECGIARIEGWQS